MPKYEEVDLLEDAVSGTEKEIISDAMGDKPLGDDDDRSLEAMEGDEPEGAEGEEGDGEQDLLAEGDDRERDPETGRFVAKPEAEAQPTGAKPQRQEVQPQRGRAQQVPLSELMTERRARQDAETRATSAQAESSQTMQALTALNARLDALAVQIGRSSAAPAKEQPAQVDEVDIFTDPNKVLTDLRTSIVSELQQSRINDRVETTFAQAHEEHGAAFEEAYKDLTGQDHRDPSARATVQRIMGSPNPGRALMKWHGEQRIVREVGGDPAKYRERVASELLKDPAFRQQLIKSMQQEAGGGGVRSVVRVPNDGGTRRRMVPSLSEAAGGSSAQAADPDLYDTSDRSAFDFAFQS